MIPKILGINTGYLEHVNGVIYYFRAIIPLFSRYYSVQILTFFISQTSK